MRMMLMIFMFGAAAFPAAAQMSVTTIGATDAGACYQNAATEASNDTAPCDRALNDQSITRLDRKKTFVNRGVIHNRNGDLMAARNDFDEALAIDDMLPEAYLNRGNSYFLAARYFEALADYERALSAGVSKPWVAWYNIGLVYDSQKNTDKARGAYEKALEENPDFTLAEQKLESLS
ncbi:tetratricopeptide repeat protein [Hyphococcus sp.]|uniref:tetratricopeptide repeat protein n=1 Tax=Hyphococcus sp. TaxID=2038636 RepID=UPI003CCBEA1F